MLIDVSRSSYLKWKTSTLSLDNVRSKNINAMFYLIHFFCSVKMIQVLKLKMNQRRGVSQSTRRYQYQNIFTLAVFHCLFSSLLNFSVLGESLPNIREKREAQFVVVGKLSWSWVRRDPDLISEIERKIRRRVLMPSINSRARFTFFDGNVSSQSPS